MSKLAEWMVRAGVELGLSVDPSPIVELSDGRTLTGAARFPHLGTARGMIVLAWDQVDVETSRLLHADGHPVSLIDEPAQDERFALEDFVALFREWGWSGSEGAQPSWMTED